MKTLLWIPLLFISITCLSANETLSIDQQITAMQQATPQERVKLMNQFKQQLASMNAEERSKSITQLREKMQQNTQTASKMTHSNAQHDQMQQSEKLQRMEQMQQRHGGDQYIHEMRQEGGEIGNNLPHKPQLP